MIDLIMLRRMAVTIEVLADEDDGITEALRRDADLEANPTQAISLTDLEEQIKNQRSNDAH